MGSSRWFTIGLVTSWYTSNIGVLLLNKYLLSNYGFRYPIFLTLCHMLACSLLSYAAIAWLKLVPMQNVRSRAQFLKISALSLVFCASVVSGNVSFRFIPVSFSQVIGSMTPFFTAVFVCLITRREALLTHLALVPVVAGVIIASGVLVVFSVFFFLFVSKPFPLCSLNVLRNKQLFSFSSSRLVIVCGFVTRTKMTFFSESLV